MRNPALPQVVAEFHQLADQREVNNPATSNARALVDDQLKFLIVIPNFLDTQRQVWPINALVKDGHLLVGQA